MDRNSLIDSFHSCIISLLVFIASKSSSTEHFRSHEKRYYDNNFCFNSFSYLGLFFLFCQIKYYLHTNLISFIILESHGAFIFVEKDQNNLNEDKYWWKPVMFFYAKTTSWIIFPLILALLIGRYFGQSFGSQLFFFLCVIAGFGITCFGIYREIKQYKKDLDKGNEK